MTGVIFIILMTLMNLLQFLYLLVKEKNLKMIWILL